MIANCQAGNILLIAYSFSCDSFDCDLWKNSQFAIKESRNQNPTYGIRSSVRTRVHIYICACTCIRVSLRLFTRKNANAVSYMSLRACLRVASIKTQNVFACKIFQHSNALWVHKLSGCTIKLRIMIFHYFSVLSKLYSIMYERLIFPQIMSNGSLTQSSHSFPTAGAHVLLPVQPAVHSTECD